METKLTREDFEGYLSQMVMALKVNAMENHRLALIIPWLQKEIKKFPKSKK